ncbi:MAG: hypothetical protein LC802_08625 [Acidobacteria bacterium]|nr:hypothetical protein [Acidobacteriota bacterium]
MPRTTRRLTVLLLALAITVSGTAWSFGTKAAAPKEGKAKSSKIMTRSQYEELQRSRAAAAAKTKAAIGKI